jgi:hypothetical protein
VHATASKICLLLLLLLLLLLPRVRRRQRRLLWRRQRRHVLPREGWRAVLLHIMAGSGHAAAKPHWARVPTVVMRMTERTGTWGSRRRLRVRKLRLVMLVHVVLLLLRQWRRGAHVRRLRAMAATIRRLAVTVAVALR